MTDSYHEEDICQCIVIIHSYLVNLVSKHANIIIKLHKYKWSYLSSWLFQLLQVPRGHSGASVSHYSLDFINNN